MSLNSYGALNLTAHIYRPSVGKTVGTNLGQSGNPSLVASSVRCSIITRESSSSGNAPGLIISEAGVEMTNIADGEFPRNTWITWAQGVSEQAIVENDVIEVQTENGTALSTAQKKRWKFTVQEVMRNARVRTQGRDVTQKVILKRPEAE